MEEVTTREEKNMNMRRSVTLKHCFGDEKTQETTNRRKKLSCSFKERRRNYIKGKIYLKQQLLKDTFTVKDTGPDKRGGSI